MHIKNMHTFCQFYFSGTRTHSTWRKAQHQAHYSVYELCSFEDCCSEALILSHPGTLFPQSSSAFRLPLTFCYRYASYQLTYCCAKQHFCYQQWTRGGISHRGAMEFSYAPLASSALWYLERLSLLNSQVRGKTASLYWFWEVCELGALEMEAHHDGGGGL